MIYIIPVEGMGNRLRVVHSAYYLLEKIKKKIQVIWLKEEQFNCNFRDLFTTIESPYFEIIENVNALHSLIGLSINPGVITKLVQNVYFDKIYRDKENKRLIKDKYNYSEIKEYKNVLIKSCLQFYTSEANFSLFQPIESLKKKIENIISPFNDTVGIHVRRTDNKTAIEYSPNHLFYTVMDHEISKNKNCNFYLASDSNEVKKEFIERYGDKIITTTADLNRNTTKGIQNALVDLYCLASTTKIYGSHYSSYSTIASKIYDIPLIRLKSVPQFFNQG